MRDRKSRRIRESLFRQKSIWIALVAVLMMLSIPKRHIYSVEKSTERPTRRDSKTVAQKVSEIQKWITELVSEEYKVRVQATRRLLKAGPDAVKPLVEVVESHDLEVAYRAKLALIRLVTTENSSYDALAQLCKSKKPAYTRVSSTLIRMPDVREVILLKETNEYNRLIIDAVDALMEERVEEARNHLVQVKALLPQFRVFKIETGLVSVVEKICEIRS
jgi:hypothetical protein